jgi:transposase
MSRKSPFTIVLTLDEERALQRMARKYTSPYFMVQRAQMILLAAEGLENKEIAERLRTRRSSVSQWRKRFFHERLKGLEDLARPGRPRAFPPKRDCAG